MAMVHRSQASYAAGSSGSTRTHPELCRHLQEHSSSEPWEADMHSTPSDPLSERISRFAKRIWCAIGSGQWFSVNLLHTSCSPSQALPLHVGSQPSARQTLHKRIAQDDFSQSNFCGTTMEYITNMSRATSEPSHNMPRHTQRKKH